MNPVEVILMNPVEVILMKPVEVATVLSLRHTDVAFVTLIRSAVVVTNAVC